MKLLVILLASLLVWAAVPQAETPRVVYLATIQGDGSESNPFRATGTGTVTNQGCIDLRADPTGSTGRMLCAADTLPAGAGINQLGDTLLENMTPVRRAVLEAVFGVTLSGATVTEIIAELLITHARTDGSRWRPLLAGKDGKFHLWLGQRTEAWTQTAWLYPYIQDNGLVADATNAVLHAAEPAVAWAASLAEDFNCANSAALTCDLTWTEFSGTAWEIASNQARVTGLTGVNLASARADISLATNNHWAQVKLIASTSDNSGEVRCGPIARKDNTGTSTFYTFNSVQANNVFTDFDVRKRVSGSATTLGTDTTNPAANDVLRVYVDGSSVSGYVNGALSVGPITDTSITTNNYGGISYSANNTTTQSCILDDFAAQDIAVVGGNSTIRRRS